MTSNLGAEVLRARAKKIGFARPTPAEAAAVALDDGDLAAVLEAAKKVLPPELWGRVDEKCVFGPLGPSELFAIARLLVRDSSRQLQRERNIAYEVTDEVIAHVLEAAGIDPTLGARPLRRAVQRICETAIARAVLRGEARPGDRLELQKLEGEIAVYAVTQPSPDDAPSDPTAS
jgi:ATP-dependent Clp protease ATP-binding subunit ClpC